MFKHEIIKSDADGALAPPPALQRRLLPFIVAQSAQSTLLGFAGVFVYTDGGMAAAMNYITVFLSAVLISITLPFALGRWWRMPVGRVVQAGFALPALLLPWAAGRPMLLGVTVGGYLGLTWAARHWIELGSVGDAERDAYATRVTVLSVVASLATTLLVSGLLALTAEAQAVALRCYAVLALLGCWLATRGLPVMPHMCLQAPWQLLRQPAWRASLPLFALESGLFGVGLAMSASGAVAALGKASYYGWAASAATLAGALALYRLRHRRHAGNRTAWMALACAGMVCAQSLLGASAWLPALYLAHVLVQAAVQPFWQASEQVLNQRVMDTHGALGDRIVVREFTLGLLRLLLLGLFWAAVRQWPAQQVLILGVGLMVSATLLEYAVGRHWLKRHSGSLAAAADAAAGHGPT
ncbi:MAG: hypothetical protein RIQ60_1713 [Pseudomonadota bacterium]|jgi:hypothetical protein